MIIFDAIIVQNRAFCKEFFKKIVDIIDDKITEDNKNAIMAPIYTSKLYWALMRMLEKDPSDRFYLII